MKPRSNNLLNFILSIILWIGPILSMMPNLFQKISILEKIIIYALMLFTVTIIFGLVWVSFFLARKYNLLKKILPSSDCSECENLLCCLKVVRPGVNYKNDIFRLESNQFIDEFELATLEARMPLKEVWIISPDLSYECEDSFFTEVIKNNLKLGVIYRFFTLNNADSRENIRKLYDKYTNLITKHSYSKKLIFYRVDAPEFDIILSLYSIFIYNPNSKVSKYKKRVFIRVGENGEEIHSVYKEIDNFHQINVTLDTIRSIMDSTKPINLSKEG